MEEKEIKSIVRNGEIELRMIRPDSEDSYMQLVRWSECESMGEFCYSLVHWTKHSEGYDVQFIGHRPFEYVQETANLGGFWAMLKYGNQLLDAEFEYKESLRW